jgi:hypothetical protein
MFTISTKFREMLLSEKNIYAEVKMKSKLFLWIFSVFLITTSFFSGVFAHDYYKTITVHYMNIKIYVNDKLITPELEPFTYESRTFVPLRFIADALDKDVTWNDSSKTIYIKDKVKQKSSETTTVYITKSGDKYHRETCSYLSSSKIPIDLQEAKQKGYTPCGRCKPPI